MRKISNLQVFIFLIILAVIIILGIVTTWLLLANLEMGDFRGIVLILSAAMFSFCYSLLIYRFFQIVTPLKEGEISRYSRQEFIYHIYILFFLLIFYPVMRSGFPPFPVMRLIYLALGAKLGDNTYSAGIIHDPLFVEIGKNSLIGQYALIIPHVIENEKLAHYKVSIGNNVTVGAHAVIMAGVTIEDNALVATGAIVTKGSYISEGEIWGGIPAKCIKKSKPYEKRQ